MPLSLNQNVLNSRQSFSWSGLWKGSVINNLWQQTQRWFQPVVSWVSQPQSQISLFMQAQSEEKYLHYRAWHTAFRRQTRQLFRDVITLYRQGKLVSPDALRESLIAQQALFDADTVSAMYYVHRLRLLAEHLPRYAHTLEGVVHHFHQQLKAYPEKAIRYFYNDLINALIEKSGNEAENAAEIRASFQSIMAYYQALVPMDLWQTVQDTIINASQFTAENTLISQDWYYGVLKALNTHFLATVEIEDSDNRQDHLTGAEVWHGMNESLKGGWHTLKAHPKAALLGAVGTTLGISALYGRTQVVNSPTSLSWVEMIQASLPSFSPLPFAVSYLSLAYTPSLGSHPSFWRITLPLVTSWVSQLELVSAQNIERWVKSLGTTVSEGGNDVQQTSDGGYIVVGYTSKTGLVAGGNDLLLSKFTADGAVSWIRTLGGSNEDIGNSVQQTVDGGYIATGYTRSFGAGATYLWLSKWAENGTVSWIRTLSSGIGEFIQQTSDGGYIVTGSSGGGAGGEDLCLSKWTENGTLSWVRTLGGTADDHGYTVQQTSDGGYIVAGYTTSFISSYGAFWLSKWTSAGALSWVRSLDGGFGVIVQRGYGVQQTRDGGFITTGPTREGTGASDLWLAKWTSIGTLTWMRLLDAGGWDEGGYVVQQTSDDGYIVVGSTDIDSYSDVFLSKWTVNGTVSWARTLGGPNWPNYDWGISGQQTSDGGYIVIGSTQSFGLGSNGSTDWLLSKWDSQGSLGGNSCVTSLNVTSYMPCCGPSALNITTATVGSPSFTTNSVTGVSARIVALASMTLMTQCNDAPVLSNNGGSFTYVENDAATGIDSTILVSDVDNTALTNANITISTGFVSGQDVLGFTNQNGITGSYNSGTGKLTLSGASSVSNYQAALRNVTYYNLSNNPSTNVRLFSFTIGDGLLNSNAITRNATITLVNDAPTLSSSFGSSFTYTENAIQLIDSGITIQDDDNTELTSATVNISAGFVVGEDVLSFTNQPGIIGSYNPATGVLSFNGTSNLYYYIWTLESVTYQNLSEEPSTNPRTFSFIVTDGFLNSNIVNRTATILSVDDAPVLSNMGGSFTYTENDAATVIDNSITITDVDNTALISGGVSISAGFANGQDVLGFTNQNGISGNYNPATGVLTLSGTASLVHYQTALCSVTYQNTAENPSTNARIFSFTVNDGTLNSNAVTPSAMIVAVNDAPVLSNSGGSFTYTENDAATVIDNSITLTDSDNPTLTSASVSISNGFVVNEDMLGFTIQSGINGNYNLATGVLTLSGAASIANYQTALRSITYRNTSNNPATNSRTFSFIVNDGTLNSNTISRSATVVAVNDAPMLTNSGGSFTYTENAIMIIDNSITLSDVDNTDLTSANVSITNGFAVGQDVLGFTNQNGINGNYNPATGVLTLSGAASIANYQAALRNVTYQNLSNNPSTATRTFSFIVNDGALNSSAVTRSATIVVVNDAPVLSNSGGSFTYIENNAPTIVDSSIIVSDGDHIVLLSASVSISAGFVASEDVLGFTNQNGITGSYDNVAGVLTLTGSSSVANYQMALRSVTYQNLSDNPSTDTRTFSFIVSDGEFNSNPITRSATVVAVNDAPMLSGSGGTFTYTENAVMVIDSNIMLVDSDNLNLTSASVSITNGFAVGEDVLGFTNQNGITGSYNPVIGVLTLSGAASVAHYQTALRSITYEDTSNNPSTNSRTFSFIVSDGLLNSNTVTRNATIMVVNDAPVLSNNGDSFTYTENNAPTVIDSSIVILDADNTELTSASVSVTNGFEGDQDVLGFEDQNGIMGSYSSGTGILTLSGTTSIAHYQTALRSVTYQNIGDNPTTRPRTFSFMANDGVLNSNAVTQSATIVAVNDAPTISANQLTINQGDTVTLTTTDLNADDVDTAPNNLQFTVSEVTHGQFERDSASGNPITTFSHQEINDGAIRFAHDGSDQAPAYQVRVNDGEYTTLSDPAEVRFIPNLATPSTPINIALIAGLASGAAVLTIGAIGASFWYVKRRQRLAKARETEMGIEMVEGIRKEKGHTVIYGKQGNYALLNKIKDKEAETLVAQTGIEVTFPDGKKKAKFELGRGQFGKLRLAKITAVKRATNKDSQFKVGAFLGVKKIKGKTEIQLSKKEADMQQKLTGKAHIMPLVESIETKGSEGQPVLYQFMPLAGFGNGETLQQYLAQVKDETEKLRILVHVAKGLLTGMANMHDSHIYHLDMKPSNIVLSKEGDMYLIDFGCAQEIAEGQLAGGNGDTRYYAPERLEQCRQIRAGKYYPINAAKVDAWAVGLTLLELGTHQYSFDTVTADVRISEWDNAYFANKLAKIEVLANAPPKTYWAIVKGLLEPNPEQRLSIEDALNGINSLRKYVFASLTAQQEAFEQLKCLEKQISALAMPNLLSASPSTEKEQHYAVRQKDHNYPGVQMIKENQSSSVDEEAYIQTPASPQRRQSLSHATNRATFFNKPETNKSETQPYAIPLVVSGSPSQDNKEENYMLTPKPESK